jgi:5,10-methylene-tetrahydrofolate dehydrogenase/methenyl tetrahydrofolate cyclohydrolase
VKEKYIKDYGLQEFLRSHSIASSVLNQIPHISSIYTKPASMDSPSVLIIGASGFIGSPVLKELMRQRTSFSRVAVLTEASRVHKFADAQANGVKIVIGSFTDPASFKGTSLTNLITLHS